MTDAHKKEAPASPAEAKPAGASKEEGMRNEAQLIAALQEMVYETTHLSREEDDGSYWCKISKRTLEQARAALDAVGVRHKVK